MHKSLSFITLIAIGIFLKIKIKGAPARDGIKTLILALALPATIFVALMKIQLSGSLFALPLLGLLINILLLLAATYFIIPIFAREESEAKRRTFKLILPSLAPGLSCFPFIVEYLGEGSLANAALMDVGNKIFVLIVLYLLAMRWYYQIQSVNDNTAKKRNTGQRIKELLTTLIREPVNAVIVLALILLSFGQRMTSLPLFVQDFVEKSHALTTGLILIFIGLAINIKRSEAQSITAILLTRSGIGFFISAIIIALAGDLLSQSLALMLVIFSQSSCSFWPLAHISAIDDLEKDQKARTFQLQTGLNVLACSLPFSSILILSICTIGNRFADPSISLLTATILLFSALALKFIPGKIRQMFHEDGIQWGKIRTTEKDQPA